MGPARLGSPAPLLRNRIRRTSRPSCVARNCGRSCGRADTTSVRPTARTDKPFIYRVRGCVRVSRNATAPIPLPLGRLAGLGQPRGRAHVIPIDVVSNYRRRCRGTCPWRGVPVHGSSGVPGRRARRLSRWWPRRLSRRLRLSAWIPSRCRRWSRRCGRCRRRGSRRRLLQQREVRVLPKSTLLLKRSYKAASLKCDLGPACRRGRSLTCHLPTGGAFSSPGRLTTCEALP